MLGVQTITRQELSLAYDGPFEIFCFCITLFALTLPPPFSPESGLVPRSILPYHLISVQKEVETHITYKNTKVWVFCENSFFSSYMGFHLTSLPRELAFHATPRALGFDFLCVLHR